MSTISENGTGRDKNDYGREKDKDREKDRRKRSRNKSRERVRSRSRERERDRSTRDSDRSSRDKERGNRDRHREKEDRGRSQRHKRDRDRSRERSERRDRDRGGGRDRSSRDRERDRNHDDDYDGRHHKHSSPNRSSHKRDHGDDRDRSRSRSHGRSSSRREREMSRERSSHELSTRELLQMEMEREVMRMERFQEPIRMEPIRLEPIKEDVRESRFDFTQTLQELMQQHSAASLGFGSLPTFNCSNSNDSLGNGQHNENSQEALERRRKRKSRWGGSENDKTFIPGMPTILPSSLDPVQQEAYLVQLQIEEISRKLRTGELGIPQNPEERSPSPEPIYSSDGKRLNTREFRYRKRLEEQRHHLIQKMQSVNPEFKPPADYKPPVTRVSDKVLIPQEEHPDINFVGLLIGPRGNTLKAMEKETGAKIIIRGKGSVKEGKVGRKDGQPLPGEDEPLHAFITAPNLDAVKKAVEKIKEVIRQGIEVPEGHNDLRRMQLRELAQLNGTLRETDSQRCTCGSTEHKSWMCPEKPIVTNTIVCAACGGIGHLTKDCRNKRPGSNVDGQAPSEDSQAKIDEEYMSLMAELGEGPPPTAAAQSKPDALNQVHMNRGYSIFEKKPNQLQAIQGAPPSQPPPLGMQPVAPPPPNWGSTSNMGIPPLIPPPPNVQPPAAPLPLMSWMAPAPQPPPPGGESMVPPIPGASMPPPPPGTTTPLQPPGTAPIPPLMAPPPPGTSAPLPPWPPVPPMYGGWGSTANGYMQPPPPPPIAPPPPGMPSLVAPPPPPPPAI